MVRPPKLSRPTIGTSAGGSLVTIDFPSVPGQKAFSWDDHASVWNIFEQMKIRLPVLDQVASAFIQDLYERSLGRVLVGRGPWCSMIRPA